MGVVGCSSRWVVPPPLTWRLARGAKCGDLHAEQTKSVVAHVPCIVAAQYILQKSHIEVILFQFPTKCVTLLRRQTFNSNLYFFVDNSDNLCQNIEESAPQNTLVHNPSILLICCSFVRQMRTNRHHLLAVKEQPCINMNLWMQT